MDDAATGGQSDLSSDPNKLVLCSALRPAQHVAAVAAWVSQSDWEVLMTNYNFESGGEDWPDAYRHSPISREESYGCVVAWWHHDWQEPAFQLYNSLLFGLPLAVTSFNRYSRFVEALGRRLLGCLVSMYFDDANIVDWASAKGNSQMAFGMLNKLLGTPFAEEKHQPMSTQGLFLGLDHDFRDIPVCGHVSFWPRQRLVDKVTDMIRQAKLDDSLQPGAAAKLYGMMNFLEQGTFGRIGAQGLSSIKERQIERERHLTPQILSSFDVILAILRDKPRRRLEIFPRPCLRFVGTSDATLERPKEGTGGFCIVWFSPQ